MMRFFFHSTQHHRLAINLALISMSIPFFISSQPSSSSFFYPLTTFCDKSFLIAKLWFNITYSLSSSSSIKIYPATFFQLLSISPFNFFRRASASFRDFWVYYALWNWKYSLFLSYYWRLLFVWLNILSADSINFCLRVSSLFWNKF